MQTDLTIMVSYDSDSHRFQLGATSRTDGDWELAASEPAGPFTGVQDVGSWIGRMLAVWSAPPLAITPSESLHDAWASHP